MQTSVFREILDRSVSFDKLTGTLQTGTVPQEYAAKNFVTSQFSTPTDAEVTLSKTIQIDGTGARIGGRNFVSLVRSYEIKTHIHVLVYSSSFYDTIVSNLSHVSSGGYIFGNLDLFSTYDGGADVVTKITANNLSYFSKSLLVGASSTNKSNKKFVAYGNGYIEYLESESITPLAIEMAEYSEHNFAWGSILDFYYNVGNHITLVNFYNDYLVAKDHLSRLYDTSDGNLGLSEMTKAEATQLKSIDDWPIDWEKVSGMQAVSATDSPTFINLYAATVSASASVTIGSGSGDTGTIAMDLGVTPHVLSTDVGISVDGTISAGGAINTPLLNANKITTAYSGVDLIAVQPGGSLALDYTNSYGVLCANGNVLKNISVTGWTTGSIITLTFVSGGGAATVTLHHLESSVDGDLVLYLNGSASYSSTLTVTVPNVVPYLGATLQFVLVLYDAKKYWKLINYFSPS